MLCTVCGRPVHSGMTDNESSFFVHEFCFPAYMNATYGSDHWMALGNNKQDEYDGYYIHTADTEEGFEGTGIYYTDFDD